jgi:hypothetical protein
MLVQQTAKFLHQQRHPRLMIKMDITKAFDSVSWSLLRFCKISVLGGSGEISSLGCSSPPPLGCYLMVTREASFHIKEGCDRGILFLRCCLCLSWMCLVSFSLKQMMKVCYNLFLLGSCNTGFLFMLMMWFSSSILWQRT